VHLHNTAICEAATVQSKFEQKEALNKIKYVLPQAGKGYLVLVEDNSDTPGDDNNNKKHDYQLPINEKGEYEILDTSGLSISNRCTVKIRHRLYNERNQNVGKWKTSGR